MVGDLAIYFSRLFSQAAGGDGRLTQAEIDAQRGKIPDEELKILNDTFQFQNQNATKGPKDNFKMADHRPLFMREWEFKQAVNKLYGTEEKPVFSPQEISDGRTIAQTGLFQAIDDLSVAPDGNLFPPLPSIVIPELRPPSEAPPDLGYKGPASEGGSALGIGGLGVYGSGHGTGGFRSIDISGRREFPLQKPESSDKPPQLTAAERQNYMVSIERKMGRIGGQFRYLYEMALQTNPKQGGKAVMEFIVRPNGTVDPASVTVRLTGTLTQAVGDGIKKVLGRIRFQIPPKEKPFPCTYSLLFTTGGSQEP